MEGVTLSKAVRQNLQAMQSTADMMSKTQNRLATGKKVNSALDNPTNFFTASALDSRASDLNSLMDSVGNAVKTLEAADNGVKAIQKLVESAQGTARQALQASKGTITQATDTAATDAVDIAADQTLTFTIDGVDTDVALKNGDDIAAAVEKINDAGLGVTAEVVSNKVVLTGSDDVHTFSVANSGTDNLDLDGETGTATVSADSETRKTLEAEFNALLTQIDQLSSDASFNGNNFLSGDNLKVTFNESGSSSLTIKGTDASSSGLGLSSITAGNFQFNGDIEATLKSLDAASTTLRSTASTFGSNLSTVQTRQDFTSSMIDTLEAGAANLTLADLNQEGANMLALQTRQQLATTALSMAAQADQSVLRLL